MYSNEPLDYSSKSKFYTELSEQLISLLGKERDWTANLANFCSLLFHTLPEVNWLGFYLSKNAELVLGPFQGKPACIRIAIGKGVCGTAAQKKETIMVNNVHTFPGHIACDSASNSEIVVPLLIENELLGVLDIDSPVFSRFDSEDKKGLELLIQTLAQKTDFQQIP